MVTKIKSAYTVFPIRYKTNIYTRVLTSIRISIARSYLIKVFKSNKALSASRTQLFWWRFSGKSSWILKHTHILFLFFVKLKLRGSEGSRNIPKLCQDICVPDIYVPANQRNWFRKTILCQDICVPNIYVPAKTVQNAKSVQDIWFPDEIVPKLSRLLPHYLMTGLIW